MCKIWPPFDKNYFIKIFLKELFWKNLYKIKLWNDIAIVLLSLNVLLMSYMYISYF